MTPKDRVDAAKAHDSSARSPRCAALDSFRVKKAAAALVPTMGALHDGHVSLVRLAKRRAAKVVVSIAKKTVPACATEL